MSSDIYIPPGTQTFSVLDPPDRRHISTVVATTVTSTATSTGTTTVSSESNEFNVSNTNAICNLESTVGRNDLVGGIPIHWFNPQTISRINNGQYPTQTPFDLPAIPAVQLSSWFRSSSPVNRACTNEVAKLGSFPIGIPTENCSKLTGTNVNSGEYQLFGSTNWQLVYPSYGSTVDGTDVLRSQPRNSVIDTYTRFHNDKANPPSDTIQFSTNQCTKTEPDLASEQVESVVISEKGEPIRTGTVEVKVSVSLSELTTTTSSTQSKALIDSTQNQENLCKTQAFSQHLSTTIGRNEADERTSRHFDTGNGRIQNCTALTDIVTSSTLTAAAGQSRSQRVVNPSHRGVSSKINSNSTRPTKPSHYKRSEAHGGLQSQSADSTGNSLSRSSYMCRKCRAHGKLLPVKQHKRNCPFRNCNCSVCSLVNYGRNIVAKQIALYRDQKNNANTNPSPLKQHQIQQSRTTRALDIAEKFVHPFNQITSKLRLDDPIEDEGPHCRRCRNHGKNNPWKGHKKSCPYRNCYCQQCILISLRKSNEKNLREVVQEFTEQRSEKRERSSNKTVGSEDHLLKGLSHQKENTTARSPGFGSNSYLPKFNTSVSFPAMGLKQPQSLFPYPYLTKLTEAYTNNKIPLALGLNAMTTQPESADSMFSQPLLSHPLPMRTSNFTNMCAHYNSLDNAMALNMVGKTPAIYTGSTEPSCYLDHLNLRNPVHTEDSITGVRTLEKQLYSSPPLHKKSAFNLAKGVAGTFLDCMEEGISNPTSDTLPYSANPVHFNLAHASDFPTQFFLDTKLQGNCYSYTSCEPRLCDTQPGTTGNDAGNQRLPTYGFSNDSDVVLKSPLQLDNSTCSHSGPRSRFATEGAVNLWSTSPVYSELYGSSTPVFASKVPSHETMFRSLIENATVPVQTTQPKAAYCSISAQLFGDPSACSGFEFIPSGKNISDCPAHTTNTSNNNDITNGPNNINIAQDNWMRLGASQSTLEKITRSLSDECCDDRSHKVVQPNNFYTSSTRNLSNEAAGYVLETTDYQTRAAAFAAAAAAAVALHHEVTQQQQYHQEEQQSLDVRPPDEFGHQSEFVSQIPRAGNNRHGLNTVRMMNNSEIINGRYLEPTFKESVVPPYAHLEGTMTAHSHCKQEDATVMHTDGAERTLVEGRVSSNCSSRDLNEISTSSSGPSFANAVEFTQHLTNPPEAHERDSAQSGFTPNLYGPRVRFNTPEANIDEEWHNTNPTFTTPMTQSTWSSINRNPLVSSINEPNIYKPEEQLQSAVCTAFAVDKTSSMSTCPQPGTSQSDGPHFKSQQQVVQSEPPYQELLPPCSRSEYITNTTDLAESIDAVHTVNGRRRSEFEHCCASVKPPDPVEMKWADSSPTVTFQGITGNTTATQVLSSTLASSTGGIHAPWIITPPG
ncbi:hypothetical protein EG68_10164 [Paragonimus skrjabini miyazakii]|uniref:DM domain-containing protein n=1 Tax=Paragonimus skrjabini miyazakii TaxID=59628 RepID=A0A8S9YGL9_9TREM|nr:hypothetical protein EG68_10164 [Paragonimus skrjabini miyazakii]